MWLAGARLGGLGVVLVVIGWGCAPVRSPTIEQRAASLAAVKLPPADREWLAERVLDSTVCIGTWKSEEVSPADGLGQATVSLSGSGYGTGVVLTHDGYLLTAAHCLVPHGREIVALATLSGPRLAVARKVWVGDATDACRDVAILKVDLWGLMPLPWAEESEIRADMDVLIAGACVPGKGGAPVSVAAGRITRLEVASVGEDGYAARLIENDAPIGRGDSGGPVVTAEGRLIGINRETRWRLYWRSEAVRPDPEWVRRVIAEDRAKHAREMLLGPNW